MGFELDSVADLKKRAARLGDFLERAENLLFKVSDEEEDIEKLDPLTLMEFYKVAAKLQIDMLEVVRKWRSAAPSEVPDEILLLAKMIKQAGVPQLTQIRKILMESIPEKSSVTSIG